MAKYGKPPTARELRRKEERAERRASKRRSDDDRRARMSSVDEASPLRVGNDIVVARRATAKDLVVGTDALRELSRMRDAGEL